MEISAVQGGGTDAYWQMPLKMSILFCEPFPLKMLTRYETLISGGVVALWQYLVTKSSVGFNRSRYMMTMLSFCTILITSFKTFTI